MYMLVKILMFLVAFKPLSYKKLIRLMHEYSIVYDAIIVKASQQLDLDIKLILFLTIT